MRESEDVEERTDQRGDPPRKAVDEDDDGSWFGRILEQRFDRRLEIGRRLAERRHDDRARQLRETDRQCPPLAWRAVGEELGERAPVHRTGCGAQHGIDRRGSECVRIRREEQDGADAGRGRHARELCSERCGSAGGIEVDVHAGAQATRGAG